MHFFLLCGIIVLGKIITLKNIASTFPFASRTKSMMKYFVHVYLKEEYKLFTMYFSVSIAQNKTPKILNIMYVYKIRRFKLCELVLLIKKHTENVFRGGKKKMLNAKKIGPL